MKRAALLSVLALAAPAAAQESEEAKAAPGGFWTEAELALIDRGLMVINASRADLGFQKRPFEDPFRLRVVNEALDAPLSIGAEAQAWDEAAAAGLPSALLEAALARLGIARHREDPETKFPADDEVAPRVPEAARDALRDLARSLWHSGDFAFLYGPPHEAPEFPAFTRRVLDSQVERPGAPEFEADAAFLASAGRMAATGPWSAARRVLPAVERLVAALAAAPAPDTRWTGVVRGKQYGTEIAVYGYGDDLHGPDETAAVVIDLGGDDTWIGGASADAPEGRRVAIAIDLAGNDRYCGRRDLSFGAALGGVAIQWDCAGDDIYDAGHASLGAGICGVGVLVDEGGDDIYRCRDFGIGAGAFGVGILLDRGGNDLYHADLKGQGFASTRGVGVLADLDGHDVYDAGGAHLHAPLYADRTQSLSQGFSIGMRPDASGGVGVLIDRKGNDRYTADIYGQGAAYWYGLGLLVDGDGNDTYTLGQYGQGSGIHLAAGMLLDRAGSDLYYLKNGVGMGGAHDYAVGLLVDRGGDDYYAGSGGTQGGALTNSVAILLDGGGKDSYAGGPDLYSETTRDGAAWAREWVGAGLDEPTPPVAESSGDPGQPSIAPEAARAAIDVGGCVPGPDGKPVDDLDRLWEMACRWEVGDNRVIVPMARERLLALGTPALDRAIERIGDRHGLEFRACEWVFARFPAELVVPRLIERSRDADRFVRRRSLQALATLKAEAACDRLLEVLESDDDARGAALSALAALKKAPPAVRAHLRSDREPTAVNAAICLGAAGDAESLAALVGALGEDHAFPVRLAAAEQLAARFEAARPRLRALVLDRSAPVVARRNALLALGRSKAAGAAAEIQECLADPDPRVRISAFRAAAELAAALDPGEGTRLSRALDAARAAETDPLVKRLR